MQHPSPRRAVVAAIAAAFVVLATPTAARAHDPIILGDGQTTPERGPLLPDGTISFALYGAVGGEGDTRAFRVRFAEGDRLHLSLLIPDLPPERDLPDAALPSLEIVDPSGASRLLRPDRRVSFAEPFTGTNYVEFLDVVEVAVAGDYAVTVVGAGAARFTVSVGDIETFGTPVEGVVDREVGIAGVMRWYGGGSEPMVSAGTPETTLAPAADDPSPDVPLTSDDESADGLRSAVIVAALVLLVLVGAAATARTRRR